MTKRSATDTSESRLVAGLTRELPLILLGAVLLTTAGVALHQHWYLWGRVSVWAIVFGQGIICEGGGLTLAYVVDDRGAYVVVSRCRWDDLLSLEARVAKETTTETPAAPVERMEWDEEAEEVQEPS